MSTSALREKLEAYEDAIDTYWFRHDEPQAQKFTRREIEKAREELVSHVRRYLPAILDVVDAADELENDIADQPCVKKLSRALNSLDDA